MSRRRGTLAGPHGYRPVLSTPRQRPQVPSDSTEVFGRFAERVARFLGTGRYLAIQTGIVAAWITLNVTASSLRWDPYPFILLNLVFSTQSAYAAPLILLAQNRQAERDRAQIERDRQTRAQAEAQIAFLARELAAVRLQVERMPDRRDITDELERLTELIEPAAGRHDIPAASPR